MYKTMLQDVFPAAILESPDNSGLADHHSTLLVLLYYSMQPAEKTSRHAPHIMPKSIKILRPRWAVNLFCSLFHAVLVTHQKIGKCCEASYKLFENLTDGAIA